jgi:hypothetical protein
MLLNLRQNVYFPCTSPLEKLPWPVVKLIPSVAGLGSHRRVSQTKCIDYGTATIGTALALTLGGMQVQGRKCDGLLRPMRLLPRLYRFRAKMGTREDL